MNGNQNNNPGFPGAPAYPQPAQAPAQAPAPQYAPQQAPPAAPATPYQQSPHMQVGGAPAPAAGIPSLADARAGNSNGRWLDPGQYVVDVTEVKIAKTFKGLYFIVSTVIVESTNPGLVPGSEASWAKSLDPAKDQYGYSRNDVKGWICLAIDQLIPGRNAAVNWDDGFLAFVADETKQPCRGMRFFCNVWEKPNKTKAGQTTIVDWEPMGQGEQRGLVPQQVHG